MPLSALGERRRTPVLSAAAPPCQQLRRFATVILIEPLNETVLP